MNNLDWTMMMQVMSDLWPKTIAKLTGEQRNAFWIACSDHTVDQCITALRDHMVSSPFAIKPSDLRKRLRERRQDDRSGSSSDYELRERHAEAEREQEEMKQAAELARGELSALEPEVLQECKRRAAGAFVTLRGFTTPPGDRHAKHQRTIVLDGVLEKMSDDPYKWSDFVVLAARAAVLEEAGSH